MACTILSSKAMLSTLDQFRQLVFEYDKLLDENMDLKQNLHEVQEMNKDLMSVSLIINTKNENEKLRNELTLLKKKLTYLEKENQQLKKLKHNPNAVYEVKQKDATRDDDDSLTDETELIEYKYNNKIYFLSDDDQKLIYDMDDDGEPSQDPVGYLENNTVVFY